MTMPDDTLFETSTDEQLILAYKQQDRTLDDLPYTDQFEAIFESVTFAGRADLFHRLHNIRKAGRLPKLGRASSQRPSIDAEQERLLIEIVEQAVGKLSLRDRLPYTPEFDRVIETFNARAGLNLSHHDAWRVIAKLAK